MDAVAHKLIRLTEQGERTRRDLTAEYHTPPPGLLGLSIQELEQLDRLLGRLG